MPIQLSYSASQKYTLSPRMYYLHYVRRLRENKLGSPLFFGGAVDEALNVLLKDKDLAGAHELFDKSFVGEDFNGSYHRYDSSPIVTYSNADFDINILSDDHKKDIAERLSCSPENIEAVIKDLKQLIKDNDTVQPEDVAAMKYAHWLSLSCKAHMMLDAYDEQVMPYIEEVLAVQEFVKLENEDGDTFIGYVDLICKFNDKIVEVDPSYEKYVGKPIIVDNKSSSITYKPDSVKESPQLATYFEAAGEEYEPVGAAYIVYHKKIRKTKEPRVRIQIILDDISEELVEETFSEYEETLKGIKTGEFSCSGECNRTPWGCAYKAYCSSDGKDMTGLVEVAERKRK